MTKFDRNGTSFESMVYRHMLVYFKGYWERLINVRKQEIATGNYDLDFTAHCEGALIATIGYLYLIDAVSYENHSKMQLGVFDYVHQIKKEGKPII